jgi:hypothetical protein
MARSRAYPVSPLETAVEDLKTLDRELGRVRHDRDAVAQALGYKSGSGAAARKVAALVQYGFVERHKDEYQVAELADHVLHPTTERERAEALRMAFFNVALFEEVVNSFRAGGRLPGQLANLLYRQHRITAAAKEEVAEILLASAESAGIIDGEGRFLDVAANETAGKRDDDDAQVDEGEDEDEDGHGQPRARDAIKDPTAPKDEFASTAAQMQRVVLTHGWAELRLPEKLTARDLKKLRKLIEVVALDVEEEA